MVWQLAGMALGAAMGGKGSDGQDLLAQVQASQGAMAKEQWGEYKRTFLPFQQGVAQGKMQALPDYINAEIAKAQAIATQAQGAIPVQEELSRQQLRTLQQTAPIQEKYYDEILQGLNVEDRMGEAQADVEQGFRQGEAGLLRTLGRTGVQGAKATDALANQAYERAKGIAFARTNARRQTRMANIGMMGTALQGRNTIFGINPLNSSANQLPGLDNGNAMMTQAGLNLNRAGTSAGSIHDMEMGRQSNIISGMNMGAGVGNVAENTFS